MHCKNSDLKKCYKLHTSHYFCLYDDDDDDGDEDGGGVHMSFALFLLFDWLTGVCNLLNSYDNNSKTKTAVNDKFHFTSL